MPDAPRLRGLEPLAAAWHLLPRAARRAGLQALREAHCIDGSAEAVARVLHAHGVEARAVVLEAEDLRWLLLPTLLQLEDGTWLVLRGRRRGRLEVADAAGPRAVPEGDLLPLLSLHAIDTAPALAAGTGLASRLWALAVPHRGVVLRVLGVTALLQGLALALPAVVGVVVNRALPDGARSLLHLVAGGVALVALFQAWAGWLRERMLLFLMTSLERAAEPGILEHLLRLPYGYLDRKTVGQRLQTVGGVAVAREMVAERAWAAVLDGAVAGVYLVVMAWILPLPTVVLLGTTLLVCGTTRLFGGAQARAQQQQVEAQQQQRGFLTELIGGIALIKVAGAEKRALQRWVEDFAVEQRHGLRRQRLGLGSELAQEALRHGVPATLLVWCGGMALQGAIPLGTLFAFVQLSIGFVTAVLGALGVYATLLAARPQLAMAEEVLSRAPEPRPRRPVARGPSLAVAMEDVWFRYGPDRPWVLKGYSLRAEPGQKVAITGHSGFGKTTVLRLLSGVYAPEEGSITVGGLTPQEARSEVLYLPQFVQIYGGTLLENLIVLSGGASPERIAATAQETGLAELVATLPMGFHSTLPHGGRLLSGGQRQLIALTAALASNRRVLLLDEAMASIDHIGAAPLYERLQAHPATVVAARHLA